MKTKLKKQDFPVSNVRHFLEPGPIALVSSKWKDQTNIMTMGWHSVMEFSPSLVGCVISAANHSFELIRKSKQCVINLPRSNLIDLVVKIGNTSGSELNKFDAFGLTEGKATHVDAPLIDECHANFECRLYDTSLINKYNFFIFEVVKAHVAKSPKNIETLHYTGNGKFTLSGKTLNKRSLFKPEML